MSVAQSKPVKTLPQTKCYSLLFNFLRAFTISVQAQAPQKDPQPHQIGANVHQLRVGISLNEQREHQRAQGFSDLVGHEVVAQSRTLQTARDRHWAFKHHKHCSSSSLFLCFLPSCSAVICSKSSCKLSTTSPGKLAKRCTWGICCQSLKRSQ